MTGIEEGLAVVAQVGEAANQQAVDIQNKMKTFGGERYAYAKLIAQQIAAQDQVKAFDEKVAQLESQQQAKITPNTIVTKAQYNKKPVKPSIPTLVAISIMGGLFLGICFALLQDFMDDRVTKLEDARRILGGVPTLGVIPMQKDSPLLTGENKRGGLLESYRVLRSNLRFAAAASDSNGEPLQLRSLIVTSTTPQEGKSTTAANLAITMALDGRWDGLQVVLVDTDLRKPTIHEKFNAHQSPGLTNVLIGKVKLVDALQPTNVENLRLLTT